MKPKIMKPNLLATLLLTLASTLAACAGPGPGVTGNSTGGIITWSPEHQASAREWAGKHCARYGRVARITSIHARYGDYIGFECYLPRHRYRRGPA